MGARCRTAFKGVVDPARRVMAPTTPKPPLGGVLESRLRPRQALGRSTRARMKPARRGGDRPSILMALSNTHQPRAGVLPPPNFRPRAQIRLPSPLRGLLRKIYTPFLPKNGFCCISKIYWFRFAYMPSGHLFGNEWYWVRGSRCG